MNMEQHLIELGLAVVGVLAAIAGIGVKKIMNNKKFKQYLTDFELLPLMFEAVLKEVSKKHPKLSAENYEPMLKVYLRKEFEKYLYYELTEKQLDKLFEVAKKSFLDEL